MLAKIIYIKKVSGTELNFKKILKNGEAINLFYCNEKTFTAETK